MSAPTHPPTRVLVVDDSALYRQSITNVLRDSPDVVVVGRAADGAAALEQIAELDPDLLTLDVQMPGIDGIGVLREIKSRRGRARAIMVSSFTAAGAEVTTEALLEGAFDFVLKPSGGTPEANREQLKEALLQRIVAFRESQQGRLSRRPIRVPAGGVAETTPHATSPCRAVLIGTSTGGPAALKTVLSKLPESLSVPVLVVQHMPPKYTQSLAARLDTLCPLRVMEAVDGAEVEAGTVLIAPGGRHMQLRRKGQQFSTQLIDDPPELGCRPAINYLLRSAADVSGRPGPGGDHDRDGARRARGLRRAQSPWRVCLRPR